MRRFQPILIGAVAGFLVALFYFFGSGPRPADRDPVFLSLVPVIQALGTFFFPGREMGGLVFLFPLYFGIPTSVGALVGLIFSVWRKRCSRHERAKPTGAADQTQPDSPEASRTSKAPGR